jgi:hypothetical protein
VPVGGCRKEVYLYLAPFHLVTWAYDSVINNKLMSNIFSSAVSAPQQPSIPSTTQLLADYNVAKAMLQEALATNDKVSESIARSAIERIQQDLNAPSFSNMSGEIRRLYMLRELASRLYKFLFLHFAFIPYLYLCYF